MFKAKCILKKCCRLLLLMSFVGVGMTGMTACEITDINSNKVAEIDYTVVEEADLPVELKKLIDERKNNTLRMTYSTKDYTYLVAGYGTMPTTGYSICVNDIYLGENAIYVDVSLIGPGQDEQVTQSPTTPYIVIKIEKRDESVVFEI